MVCRGRYVTETDAKRGVGKKGKIQREFAGRLELFEERGGERTKQAEEKSKTERRNISYMIYLP